MSGCGCGGVAKRPAIGAPKIFVLGPNLPLIGGFANGVSDCPITEQIGRSVDCEVDIFVSATAACEIRFVDSDGTESAAGLTLAASATYTLGMVGVKAIRARSANAAATVTVVARPQVFFTPAHQNPAVLIDAELDGIPNYR